MFSERTSVGLDVHARSVAVAAIDGVTGELFTARLTPARDHIRGWLRDLPGPIAVAYEAGPTGFGLARALGADGIRCVVAAPSKLQRPSGDRVKTDARDAMHLARLLRLDEITAVVVPSPDQEAARDLVRAREDCRGDLMRARHRLSKLLLRQGIVYSDGGAWTGAHDRWLRRQRFDTPATTLTFEADYEALLSTGARRDRLDTAIAGMAADSEFTPVVRRLSCLRGVSTLTAFALAVEIGDWHRFTGNSIGSFVGLCPASTPPEPRGSRARSPRPATLTPAGCSSRPPGTTAPATSPARSSAPVGNSPHRRHAPAGTPATAACTHAGPGSTNAANAPSSLTSPSPANSPAGAGHWQSSSRDDRLTAPRAGSPTPTLTAARGATRDTAMSSEPSPPSTLDTRPAPAEQPVLR